MKYQSGFWYAGFKSACLKCLASFLCCFFYITSINSQVNNWEGDVSADYFNKQNWSDTTLNFTSLNAWTLRIGAGTPNGCVLNGGNSSNVNYRPGRLNTLGGSSFTVNGAVYPNNNDSLNGNIILNAPADLNIRNIVYIANQQNATITINGGSLSSRNGMNIASGATTALVNILGGSLNAGAGGANMDLNLATGASSSATVNISGGSLKVGRNLNIGASAKIHISSIGLLQVFGDKRAQLSALVADGRLTCTTGKTLSIEFDGANTQAFIPQNPNSMLREFGDSIVLNNGIIRARIEKRSGNILSLKYNGVEQLNQFGSSRTGAYHDFQTSYGFETMNNCILSIKKDTTDIVDISLKRVYNPSTGQVTPADADIHYVLNKGDTGLYSYSILEHKPSYPSFDLGSWRLVEWIAQDGTNYLCERIYVDSLRNWEMPSVFDFNNASPSGIEEIVKLNTGVRAGKYDGKYEYSAAFWDVPVWGHASNKNNIGTWVVLSSPEYFNGGPTHQDLNAAAGINHVLLNGLHYGDKSFVIPQGEQWSKIYGPYLLYTTSKTTGDENWAAAKARAEVEKAKWPYTWLTNVPEYPLAAQRGSVSGRLIINDAAKPNVSGANAWVGLTIISNTDNEWQHEGKNYHYWVKADAMGNFTIPNVRPGTFSLFAYNDGVIGDYRKDNVIVTANTTTILGNITWSINRSSGNLLWEIGIANRKTSEFRLGKFDYVEGFVERKFRDTFPATIEYHVADNDWATKIPFAHTKYPDASFAPANLWKWRLNFKLPANIPTMGNAKLTIVYASTDHAQQWIYVNNESSTFTTYFPNNADGNALIRQANYAKYSYKEILIPMSRLRAGDNTITLEMPSNSLWVSHHMYDYISLEAPIAGLLPLNIITFNAAPLNEQQIQLKWTTAAASDLAFYEVQKSINGTQFESIGNVTKHTSSSGMQSYNFIDNSPFRGLNYYRLKQVNKDGSVQYTSIQKVQLSNIGITIYPNPTKDKVLVNSVSGGVMQSIQLFDQRGKRLKSLSRISSSQATISLQNLPPGSYVIKVNDSKTIITKQIQKL